MSELAYEKDLKSFALYGIEGSNPSSAMELLMPPKIENDTYFKNLIVSGAITVTAKGFVFNTKTKRNIGYSQKLSDKGNGCYRSVGWKDPVTKKVIHIQVHRLVWIAHNGPIPLGLTINHKDGNKSNNSINNLEVASYSDNNCHAISAGLKKHSAETLKKLRAVQSGERHPFAKLTNKQAVEIRNLYSKDCNMYKLAEIFGCSYTSINRIINRKSYRDC